MSAPTATGEDDSMHTPSQTFILQYLASNGEVSLDDLIDDVRSAASDLAEDGYIDDHEGNELALSPDGIAAARALGAIHGEA